MSDAPKPKPGTIGWIDITVPDADGLKAFYESVAGWTSTGFDMGGYSDYVMLSPEGAGVAGVCHRRGTNANLPSGWILYIVVEDLDKSLGQCTAKGGKQLTDVKDAGSGRFAMIEDPSGAVCALYQNN